MPDYVFVDMKLGDLLAVLLDHQFSFEQLKEMNPVQLDTALTKINAGELKSYEQVRREKREQAIAWNKPKRR